MVMLPKPIARLAKQVARRHFTAGMVTFPLIMLFLSSCDSGKSATSRKLENMLYLELKNGRVVIEMYKDAAPKHVARIKDVVRQ